MRYKITFPIRENLEGHNYYDTFSDLLDVRRYLETELEIHIPDMNLMETGGDMDLNKFFVCLDMPATSSQERALHRLLSSFARRYDLQNVKFKTAEQQ